MEHEIAHALRQLEISKQIKVIMAAETGSHSFGLQSLGSDKDIRFIYVYEDIKKYVSLQALEEVMTLQQNGLDIEGWDLFKASRLFVKSNPSLFEWFQSRQVLSGNKPYINQMQEILQENYSLRTLGYHYRSIVERNRQTLLNSGEAKKIHKTLVQMVRSYLMLTYIIQKRQLPPLSVWCLVNAVELTGDEREWYTKLFEAKVNEVFFTTIESSAVVKILEGKLPYLENELVNLPVGKIDMDRLDEINWRVITTANGNLMF